MFDWYELTRRISDFCRDRDWQKFHNPKNLAIALSVEASELLENYQWLTEQEASKFHKNKVGRERIEEELADVAIYLIRLFEVLDIDAEAAIKNKLHKNEQKYPVEQAKGKSTKYNDLRDSD